jgi:hypothetical protein
VVALLAIARIEANYAHPRTGAALLLVLQDGSRRCVR